MTRYTELLGYRTTTKFTQPSMTKQSFRDECDIRKIMARMTRGIPPPGQAGSPIYADFTSVDDFLDAQTKLKEAAERFDQLPARIRSRFRNSPAELLMFVLNENNREEAIELGLIPKPKGEPEPIKVKVIPDAPPAAPAAPAKP